MNIVLNEYSWAEQKLMERDLGAKPVETLTRIAKYYLASGQSRNDVRKRLEEYLQRCDPYASVVKWADTIEYAAKCAEKYPLIELDCINITDGELKIISDIKGVQAQRLMFTLLCLSRYWDAASPSNNGWVNVPDKDIMKMANISTSIKRQSALFAQLNDCGYISFSNKIDNLNVQVKLSVPGDVVMEISDFRNLGYQYLNYVSGGFYKCECCGLVSKIKEHTRGPKPKYCADCAAKIHTKQIVESVMRQRKRYKS